MSYDTDPAVLLAFQQIDAIPVPRPILEEIRAWVASADRKIDDEWGGGGYEPDEILTRIDDFLGTVKIIATLTYTLNGCDHTQHILATTPQPVRLPWTGHPYQRVRVQNAADHAEEVVVLVDLGPPVARPVP